METQLAVTVIIPTYNREVELKQTLLHLLQQTVEQFEIIVVDNSSSDNTADMVANMATHSRVPIRYLVKPPNGPASARNLGLVNRRAPRVLFLDSDVNLKPDWIEKALDFLTQQPAVTGVGGAVIYDFDRQRVNAFGGDIGYFGFAWDLCENVSIDRLSEPEQRIWINCSAMLINADALEQVGGFDERYFYGYEDSDIGWKLNIAGYSVWVHPELHAYHKVQAQPGEANGIIVRHYCKNRLASLIQNAQAPGIFGRVLAYLIFSAIDLVLKPYRHAKLSALVWNVGQLKTTLTQRKVIQALRKVTDEQIFALGEKRWFPPTPLNGQRRRPVEMEGAEKEESSAKADDRV
ncbi:glycosyltransferase family 2 protein [Aestuariibacter sp. GS-14]|uniref:glycosyltransferase family 2 protein n=1 Tax=Aestuariibacter sp. GS-14 TaxID=2590670 RepID=UPI0015E86CC2|nr:glycosyltransferase family 2 protein [Aestuariibacter sp. GS-14]